MAGSTQEEVATTQQTVAATSNTETEDATTSSSVDREEEGKNSMTRDLVRKLQALGGIMAGSTQEKVATTQQTVAARSNTESQDPTTSSSVDSEEEGMARSRTTASVDSIPPDSPANLIT